MFRKISEEKIRQKVTSIINLRTMICFVSLKAKRSTNVLEELFFLTSSSTHYSSICTLKRLNIGANDGLESS